MRRLLIPFSAVLIMAASPPPRSTPAAPPPAAGTPVPLSSQPGTALDAAARALSAQDLGEARQAGERPLILVGSATLGSATLGPGGRPALFVQLQSARECGSAGCSTSVYLWRGGAWVRVLDGVAGKLIVAATRTRGMADLITDRERYVWDGNGYRDSRPAPQIDLRPRVRR